MFCIYHQSKAIPVVMLEKGLSFLPYTGILKNAEIVVTVGIHLSKQNGSVRF